jgi:hypothetical protein
MGSGGGLVSCFEDIAAIGLPRKKWRTKFHWIIRQLKYRKKRSDSGRCDSH